MFRPLTFLGGGNLVAISLFRRKQGYPIYGSLRSTSEVAYSSSMQWKNLLQKGEGYENMKTNRSWRLANRGAT